MDTRSHWRVTAAAALAVAGVSWTALPVSAQNVDNQLDRAADRATDNTNRAAEKTGAAMDRAGERARDAADRTGTAADRTGDRAEAGERNADRPGVVDDANARLVRDALSDAVNAAAKTGTFDDLVERFVDADRNRIGSVDDDQLAALEGRVEQLRADWKAKYDDDLEVDDDTFSDPFARLHLGEVHDPDDGDARTAAGAVPPAKGQPNPNQPQPGREGTATDPGGVAAGERRVGTAADGGANTSADANREPGRNIATVVVPASHGLPELRVPMLQEFPGTWKIDVPDAVDAARLRANLDRQLTEFGNAKVRWPATEEEANRLLAHRVLMAVLDVQAGSAAQSSAAHQQHP